MYFVMPKMNGPEATSKIRELGYTGPIIGVTGNALQQDHDIFMQAGASQIFTKPFVMQDLVEAINASVTASESTDIQTDQNEAAGGQVILLRL